MIFKFFRFAVMNYVNETRLFLENHTKKREMLIHYYRALETSMKKQSEIQLAKTE